ncbi:ABC transporter permease [Candidatus Saccharibacteria bacterium]|nr:ABC transporter permease [Candidatus Saccharibacteria bacterium]
MKKTAGKYRYSLILLRELVKTDFKLRYQGSVLGMLWSVLKPVMLFAVMYIVFVRFLRFGAGIPHFAVSLLLALTLWSFFAESASQGMRAIVDRGSLLRKINFPKYIVVVSATVSALINLSINLVVVLIFAIINGVDFSWYILLAPMVILQLYIFSLAVAFLLATLYVKWRDIGHIWEVILQTGFYATPIIYPLTLVAAQSVLASKILLLNPMAQMIQDLRYLLIYDGTETVWNYIGNFWVALIPILFTIMLAILAGLYFYKSSRRFTEEI